MIFRCWSPWTNDEEGARAVAADSARHAAELHAEARYYDSDYPREQRILVRDEAGELHAFDVSTTSPGFEAQPAPVAPREREDGDAFVAAAVAERS